MIMPADLTDQQLRAIHLAEHEMPFHLRRRYIELVAEQMVHAELITDETVDRAIETARTLAREFR